MLTLGCYCMAFCVRYLPLFYIPFTLLSWAPFFQQSWKWKMAPLETKLIFQGPIFHFHDYGGIVIQGVFCFPFFPLLRNDTYAGASGWWQGHILASNMWKQSHAASKIIHVQQPSIAKGVARLLSVCTFMHVSVRRPSIHVCILSLSHWLTHSSVHSFIHSHSSIHPFLRSFGRVSIQSVSQSIHPSNQRVCHHDTKMNSECFRFDSYETKLKEENSPVIYSILDFR